MPTNVMASTSQTLFLSRTWAVRKAQKSDVGHRAGQQAFVSLHQLNWAMLAQEPHKGESHVNSNLNLPACDCYRRTRSRNGKSLQRRADQGDLRAPQAHQGDLRAPEAHQGDPRTP